MEKFWIYIKQQKTDHQGISSLKQDGKLIIDRIPQHLIQEIFEKFS
jgi:hypothetical protein